MTTVGTLDGVEFPVRWLAVFDEEIKEMPVPDDKYVVFEAGYMTEELASVV